jgi:hypothetical protein
MGIIKMAKILAKSLQLNFEVVAIGDYYSLALKTLIDLTAWWPDFIRALYLKVLRSGAKSNSKFSGI